MQAGGRLPPAVSHIAVPLPAGLAHVVCRLPGEIRREPLQTKSVPLDVWPFFFGAKTHFA